MRLTLRMAFAVFLAGSASLSSAWACTAPVKSKLAPSDAERMARFSQTQLMALGEAMTGESEEERQVVQSLYAPGTVPLTMVPDGAYRCRTIKMGGLLPLTVYGYFDCEISDGGRVIEKLTGSQRFSGKLSVAGDALFYGGALHYDDEGPIAYGSDPERDQVGCLYRIAGEPERYRLDLAAPRFESTHDVIELVRQD